MKIPAAVVADLRLLDEVVDGSLSDTCTTLVVLVSDAAQAIPSYLGLSVVLPVAQEAPLEVTMFETRPELELIGASLRFGVQADSSVGPEGPAPIELILYAAQPGAFVDLVADLSWLTGRPLHDFCVDEDLAGPQDRGETRSLTSWSTINQARGVLISRGLTVDQADSELDARAAASGMGRHLAAADLLDAVSRPDRRWP